MSERWLPVPGYEDYYEVSDLGRVRGLPRTCMRSDGIRHSRKERILAASRFIRNKDYRRVCLCVDGVNVNRQVHMLVLEAFVGPCPDGQETRHLNGVQDDNRLTNLAWGTRIEQQEDVLRHGNRARGARHGMVKLKETDIPVIRAAFEAGQTTQQIARRYGVVYQTIIAILQKKSWSYVS
jgi:hypothetical protein